MAAADAPPTGWPTVECDTEGCTTTDHWKRMHNVKRTEFFAKYKSDGEDIVSWTRTCWECVMKKENLSSEGEARAFIITECPGYQQKKRRAAEHKESNEKVKEHFPLITKYKDLRILTRDEIEGELLAPIFNFLVLKSRQKDEHAKIMTDYAAKVASLKSATTKEQVIQCNLEIKEFEKSLSDNEEQMSFKEWDQPTKERFILACDYSDLLWEIKSTDGRVIAYLSAYYICRHD